MNEGVNLSVSPLLQHYSDEDQLRGCVYAKLLQSCLALCDPMDCSPPGSSVHGIFQARTLEWVAMPSSGDLPGPEVEPVSLETPALQADSFLLSHQGTLRMGNTVKLGTHPPPH